MIIYSYRRCIMKPLIMLMLSCFLTLITGWAIPSVADDVELYYHLGEADSDTKPNILFILDRSGSMGELDGTGETRFVRLKTALKGLLSSPDLTDVNVGLMSFTGVNNAAPTPDLPNAGVHYPVSYIDDFVDRTIKATTVAKPAQASDDAEEGTTGHQMTLHDDTVDLTTVANAGQLFELVTRQIAAGENDVEEKLNNGSLVHNDDLEFYKDGSVSQRIGLRFTDIPIAKDATILDARLIFMADRTDNGINLNLTIVGEKSATANAFGTASYTLRDRPKTTASVDWSTYVATDSANYLTAWTQNKTYRSPNLTTVVQEIVNQTDWATNNAMAFYVTGTSTGSPLRRAKTYEDKPAKSAILEIKVASANQDANQWVGVRFVNVEVPQGAIITHARLDFVSNANTTGNTSLTIKAEKVADSSTFGVADGNISDRLSQATTASATWGITSAWQQNDIYSSPADSGLVAVVQEVVNQGAWCGGNAMSFILSAADGSLPRNAVSFDQNPDSAPQLHIEFDPTTVAADACSHETYMQQINSSANDVEENAGTMSTTSTDLEFMVDGSNRQRIGLRFIDIPIRAGVQVLDARLIFTAKDNQSVNTLNGESLALTIQGEKNASPDIFSSNNNTLRDVPKTTASVIWSTTVSEDDDHYLTAWQQGKTYVSPDLSAVVQELIDQAGWLAYNNMAFVISGTGGLRRASTFNHAAYEAPVLQIKINSKLGDGLTAGYGKTVRRHLINLVEEMVIDSYTPLVPAIYEAAQYFIGGSVRYGKTRNNISRQIASHDLSHTSTNDIPVGCADSNSYSSACAGEQVNMPATYIQPPLSVCQPNFIVFLTDGEPTITDNNLLTDVPTMAGTAACQNKNSNNTHTFTANEKCGVDVVKFLYENDLSVGDAGLAGLQNVKTYTIGFNLGNNTAAVNYLNEWAKAGGTQMMYPANTADELLSVFKQILVSIKTDTTSFASPSLSINAFSRQEHDNEVYMSFFKPEANVAWPGNIKKYRLCTTVMTHCTDLSVDTGKILDLNYNVATVTQADVDAGTEEAADIDKIKASTKNLWWESSDGEDGGKIKASGAGKRLPLPANRKCVSNLTGTTNVDLSLSGNSIDNSGLDSALINWIKGTNREWAFGDILHSSPIIVTYGKYDNGGQTTQIKKLFAASNEGALRMINTQSGVEEWMFIPQDLLSMQQTLKDNRAMVSATQKLYGLDGPLSTRIEDANNNGKIEPASDKVQLFVAMRRGGRNLYALDVTPSAQLTNDSGNGLSPSLMPTLLWEIKGGAGGTTNFQHLGQTWSKAIPAKAYFNAQKINVLFFAGGYDPAVYDTAGADSQTLPGSGSSNIGNAIYMVGLDGGQAGKVLWMASNSTNTSQITKTDGVPATLALSAMNYAIPSDLTLLDKNNDGAIDRIYVGDMGGQLWRIDLGQGLGVPSTSEYTHVGGVLAQVADDTDHSKKRRFFYPPDVVALEDKGYSVESIYDLVMIQTGFRPHPLSKRVDDRFYALRDRAVGPLKEDPAHPGEALQDTDEDQCDPEQLAIGDPPCPTPNSKFFTLTEARLYNATANLLQDGDDAVKKTERLKVRKKLGWYIDLEGDGEKGYSKPLVLGGIIFFTTFLPPSGNSASTCSVGGEGYGRLYAIDILTGGAKVDLDDQIPDDEEAATLSKQHRFERLGEGIPTDAAAVISDEGFMTPQTGTGGGAHQANIIFRIPQGQQYWIEE